MRARIEDNYKFDWFYLIRRDDDGRQHVLIKTCIRIYDNLIAVILRKQILRDPVRMNMFLPFVFSGLLSFLFYKML